MPNRKVLMIRLIAGQIKKMLLHKISQYFAKRHERFDGDISVNLDLSNYIIKADLKKETTVDTSDLAKKIKLN